jgi:hypothetical protein
VQIADFFYLPVDPERLRQGENRFVELLIE